MFQQQQSFLLPPVTRKAPREVFHDRPYQTAALKAIDDKFAAGAKSLLVVKATGLGKTVFFSKACKKRMEDGERSIIIVHRDELIRQAAKKIESICGIVPGIDKAGERSSSSDQIVIGSVQTLIRRKNLPGDRFGLAIIDEAHHATEDNTYGGVLENLSPPNLLGVTATPWRSDKKKLASVFEDTAFTMTLMDGIQQGYLVDIKVKTMPVKIDLSDVKSKAGDFSESDLGDALEPMLDQLADIVARDYADKKILAFLPLVENSQLWTKKLCERGLSAEHVDGESQDRKAILARFHTGETMQLSCSMLLTEGYDEPTIDIVMPLRATRSRVLFSQMVGRGTRPLYAAGYDLNELEARLAAIAGSVKPKLLVLDPVFISERHNVITVADIATEEDGQAGRVNEIMRKKDKPLDEAIDEDNASQHERLAKALRENAHRSAYEKAIAELAFTLDISGLKEWEPTHEWHKEQASQRQVEALARCGVDTSVISCKGMASVVMDTIVKRRGQGLATLKQVRMLLRLGHPAPDKMKFADASAEIDKRLRGKAA